MRFSILFCKFIWWMKKKMKIQNNSNYNNLVNLNLYIFPLIQIVCIKMWRRIWKKNENKHHHPVNINMNELFMIIFCEFFWHQFAHCVTWSDFSLATIHCNGNKIMRIVSCFYLFIYFSFRFIANHKTYIQLIW